MTVVVQKYLLIAYKKAQFQHHQSEDYNQELNHKQAFFLPEKLNPKQAQKAQNY